MTSTFSLETAVIKRSGFSAVVYDLSDPATVEIRLPVDSSWTSGLHWHDHHIEYLQVIKGSIRVILGDCDLIVSANDETTEIKVERGVWHEWKRAYVDQGEEVVVKERTEPQDGQKAVFFWVLNGVIFQAQRSIAPPYIPQRLHIWLLEVWITLSLSAIFYKLDNIPVYINFPRIFKRSLPSMTLASLNPLMKMLDRLLSRILLMTAFCIAWLVGIRPVKDAFTPEEVRDRWKGSNRDHRT